MFKPIRIVATIVYLISMVMTLIMAFAVRKPFSSLSIISPI
jgi:hypothetical protein